MDSSITIYYTVEYYSGGNKSGSATIATGSSSSSSKEYPSQYFMGASITSYSYNGKYTVNY